MNVELEFKIFCVNNDCRSCGLRNSNNCFEDYLNLKEGGMNEQKIQDNVHNKEW